MNKLIGDEKNGLELRYQKNVSGVEFLDEIILTVDGKVVCHAEKMYAYNILFIFEIAGQFIHIDFGLDKMRSVNVQINP